MARALFRNPTVCVCAMIILTMLASAVYPNNKAYLEAWITNAQSLKPECKMPNIDQFSGTQLTQLVSYLRQLQ